MRNQKKENLRNVLLYALSLLTRDSFSKVLIYHDVFGAKEYTDMGTPLSMFAAHVRCARELGFNYVKEVTAQTNQLHVCIDDGFLGIYDVQDYFLREHVFPTVFIAVDLVGKPNYLDWKQICELQSCGFRFESHAWSHKTLNRFSKSALDHELKDSRCELSNRLGRDVRQLCFPQGGYSALVYEKAKEAGYAKMFSCVPGAACCPVNDCADVIRRNLVQFADVYGFKGVIRGALGLAASHYFNLGYRDCSQSNS